MLLYLLSAYLGFTRAHWLKALCCGIVGAAFSVAVINGKLQDFKTLGFTYEAADVPVAMIGAALTAVLLNLLAYWAGRGLAGLTGRGKPRDSAASELALVCKNRHEGAPVAAGEEIARTDAHSGLGGHRPPMREELKKAWREFRAEKRSTLAAMASVAVFVVGYALLIFRHSHLRPVDYISGLLLATFPAASVFATWTSVWLMLRMPIGFQRLAPAAVLMLFVLIWVIPERNWLTGRYMDDHADAGRLVNVLLSVPLPGLLYVAAVNYWLWVRRGFDL